MLVRLFLLTLSLVLSYSFPAIAAHENLTLTLTGPAQRGESEGFVLSGSVKDEEGAPAEEVPVVLERLVNESWTPVDEEITDALGTVTFTIQALDEQVTYYRLSHGIAVSNVHSVTVVNEPIDGEVTLGLLTKDPLKLRKVVLRLGLSHGGEVGPETQAILERKDQSQWSPVRTVKLSKGNPVKVTVMLTPADSQEFRLVLPESDEYEKDQASLTVRPRDHLLKVAYAGKNSVKDGDEVQLLWRVTTQDKRGVPAKFQIVGRIGDKPERVFKQGVASDRGWIALKVRPRWDSRWRIEVQPGSYYSGKTSPWTSVDNVPPGAEISLPGPAPKIKLPPQKRAFVEGPNVRVQPVPGRIWASMQGKSWRPGCTARSNLKYITATYYGFDGYLHRGELVVASAIAGKYRAALEGFYRAKIPIRSMYLVDRFGYSSRLRGADDYKSMAADNTSAFNCRDVVGRPGVKSPHTSGRSFDINPWENPYASSNGWVPNSYWVGKTHPLVAWRSGSHRVVKTMRAAGFRWTYGVRDAHHFDG